MTIEARRHPLDDTKSILMVSASSTEEIRRALPKLRHYGKYSYLHFQGGVLTEKRFSAEPFGYIIDLNAEPKISPDQGTAILQRLHGSDTSGTSHLPGREPHSNAGSLFAASCH
jgi:hypothetical protein